MCYSASQPAAHSPCLIEADYTQEQPSSPVMALSPGPIRFRRAKVEVAKNCPSRNDTNRLTVRRGRWTSGLDVGRKKKKKILAFKWLYQCRDYQDWGDKEWIISQRVELHHLSRGVSPLKRPANTADPHCTPKQGRAERNDEGSQKKGTNHQNSQEIMDI